MKKRFCERAESDATEMETRWRWNSAVVAFLVTLAEGNPSPRSNHDTHCTACSLQSPSDINQRELCSTCAWIIVKREVVVMCTRWIFFLFLLPLECISCVPEEGQCDIVEYLMKSVRKHSSFMNFSWELLTFVCDFGYINNIPLIYVML